MPKLKTKKESGITLVALIITIIILVILAAVTIKEVFGNGFLELAAKGAENYAIAQTEEENMMNELENFIKDKLNEIDNGQGTQNSAPRWAEGGEPNSVEERKTDTQITIAMTAIDDDGDDLTYIIKYYMCNEDGTKGEYLGEKKIEDAPEGEEQTVDINGLGNYTEYKFEIVVSDGKEVSDFYSTIIRTYCLGIKCDEGRILTSSETCPDCKRKNKKMRWSSVCITVTIHGTTGWYCPSHQVHYKSSRVSCSSCGARYSRSCCPQCAEESGCTQIVHVECDICNSKGTLPAGTEICCSTHGVATEHYYCSVHKEALSKYH